MLQTCSWVFSTSAKTVSKENVYCEYSEIVKSLQKKVYDVIWLKQQEKLLFWKF